MFFRILIFLRKSDTIYNVIGARYTDFEGIIWGQNT